MDCFLGSVGQFKYMGKAIIKPIKIPLRFIGDQVDFGPDPGK